jgi:hypothetical protein
MTCPHYLLTAAAAAAAGVAAVEQRVVCGRMAAADAPG